MGFFSGIGKALGSIGSIVSGNPLPAIAGSVLSSGVFGGARKGPGPRSSVRQAIRGARDEGLHGLAALGGGSSFSGVDGGSLIGDLGAAISGSSAAALDHKRASEAEAGSKADRDLRKAVAAKEMALIDAEILESRSRTILNQTNAKRVQSSTVFGTGTQGGLENGDRPVVVEPLRDQIWNQTVEGPGGTVSVGPNPEAFEIGLSELVAGGLIHGPQWLIDAAQKKAKAAQKKLKRQGPIPWEMEASP